VSDIFLNGRNLFKSLQWKIVLVYSLLLLFSLQLISVYLVQSLEQYSLQNFKSGLEVQARLLSVFLTPRFIDISSSADDIAHLVQQFGGTKGLEVVVLDSQALVTGASGNQSLLGRRLIRDEIAAALTGEIADAIRVDPVSGERRYYLAFPLRDQENILGLIYLSGSLRNVDSVLNQVKLILLTGAAVALTISFILGIILTRTITTPIQAVTHQASLMAKGDYSRQIKVEASDEIGQLGETFNFLAERLSYNIREITSEKSKVEAIINNMSDGVIALDGRGRLIHINPAARSLLAILKTDPFSAEDSGFNVLKKMLGRENMRLFTQQKRSFSTEISREKPPCTVKVTLVPFKVEKGRMNGTLLVLHDITGERELSKRQQEFVADVSHELRTPLTTVKSYIETLLDGAVEEPAVRERFLRVVEQETERMVSLVKDLLALSQLDYSQVEWHKTDVELRELFQEVVDQCRQKADIELPKIKISASPEMASSFVDRGKVVQALANILNNAVRYTAPSGEVEISATAQDSIVTIMIADTGVGIPPDDLPRVFERFYRVEKTRSRDHGGTGLGLPIARKVVEAHGGKIWIESSLNKGTKVWFTLPQKPGKEVT
jgi:two-component system sensor histidine kinase VicK